MGHQIATCYGGAPRGLRGELLVVFVAAAVLAIGPSGVRQASAQELFGPQLAPVVDAHHRSPSCGCAGCTSFYRQSRFGISPPIIIEGGSGGVICEPYGSAPDAMGSQDIFPSPLESPDRAPSVPAPPQGTDPFSDAPSPAGMGESGAGTGMDMSDAFSASPSTSNQLASAFGGSAGGYGSPGMMGDFFGGGYRLYLSNPSGNGDDDYNGNGDPQNGGGDEQAPVSIPIAGGDRRRKLADHTSPFPQNRLSFAYNHYRNATTDIFQRDQHVNRYMFGIERTFLDHLTSIDLRIPFAGGVSSTQALSDPDTLGTEFGNLSVTFKGLLIRSPRFALSTGLTAIFPTADDVVLSGLQGAFSEVRFDSGSVHLAPFLATWYAPSPRLFHQFFVQTDFDTGGYEVVFDNQTRGQLQEQSLLYLDYSVGCWIHRNPNFLVRGIAPIFELHYTTTMQDADPGPLPGLIAENRRDVLNVTGGLHCQVGRATSIRFGGGSPLRPMPNREFDAEFLLQLTRFY